MMFQTIDAACAVCGWQRSCTDAQMVEMLRAIRKLSVSKSPEGAILAELFRHSAAEMNCPQCGERSLRVGAIHQDDDWPVARACSGCGRAIEPERLEAIPEATLCVACQQSFEQHDKTVEHEFCDKCGSPMQLVPSRGRGISRYVLRCSGGCR